MDALEAPTPHTAEWKEFIRQMRKPAALKLGEKPGTEKYKHEKQDPKHRMGDLLEVCFTEYQKRHPDDPDGNHFYRWLDDMPDQERVAMISNHPLMRKAGKVDESMVEAFLKGVAYMDKLTRKGHKVDFRGGTAFRRPEGAGRFAQEFDTDEMKTVFSGMGFAIWVMSEKGRMFAGNHVKGLIHHSSFLAGADVMCGGEVKAHRGKIELVSAKSGHYQPGMEHLVWALTVLRTCVDNFDRIRVMAWRYPTTTPLRLISPTALMQNPNVWQWGNLTQDELARLQRREYGTFPD